jgi:cytochrome c biogenesis protein CcmG/thiol:disulfide interchange protein DsbE
VTARAAMRRTAMHRAPRHPDVASRAARARATARALRAGTLALAVTLAGCRAAQDAGAFVPLAIGKPVPAFTVPTLAGDSARVGPGAGRQPVTLVNVWATWCGPCRAEFPELARLHAEFAPRGLRVLAVAIDAEGAAAVRPFVAEQGATFTIALDPADTIRQRYFALGVPESWLVSADGRLLWRQVGAIPAGAAAARAAIAAALAGPG